jgi:hypothetical protein
MRLAIVVALLASACTDEPSVPGDDPDFEAPDGLLEGDLPPSSDWTEIGNGVVYRQVNTGRATLIAYGGYTARTAYSSAWAEQLVDAKLGAAGVGHIYAVKGPMDSLYNAREIGNTKLRAHLNALANADGPVYVIAHSSGAFVAHELFGQAHDAGDTELLARMSYADLDGGGSGLSAAIVGELGAATFVYAQDPTLASGRSQNAGTAIALASGYAAQGATGFAVTVSGTGCMSGAGWCLHDVVITHKPHNPSSYDLAHDYVDFVDRPVTTEYLDPLLRP